MEAIAIRLEAIIAIRLEAIAIRFEAIAIRLEAIAIRLEAIAIRLEAIAIRLEAIEIGLEARAIRLEAIAIRLFSFFLSSERNRAEPVLRAPQVLHAAAINIGETERATVRSPGPSDPERTVVSMERSVLSLGVEMV